MTYNPPTYVPTTYCTIDGPYEIIFRRIYNHNQNISMFFASIFHAHDILESIDLIDFKHYLHHSIAFSPLEISHLTQLGFDNCIITRDHIGLHQQECSAVLSNEPLCGWIDQNGHITQLHHNTIVPQNLFRKNPKLENNHEVYYYNPQRTPCIKPNAYWIVSQDLSNTTPKRGIFFEENVVSYYVKDSHFSGCLFQTTLNYAKYLQGFGIECVAKQLINGNKVAYCIEISAEQMTSFELFRRLSH